MNTIVKATITALMCHIEFSKSGVLIYNSEALDTAGTQKQKQKEEHRQM